MFYGHSQIKLQPVILVPPDACPDAQAPAAQTLRPAAHDHDSEGTKI